MRRRLLHTYLGLFGVRARHAKRAVSAWRESRTILFVCYGNICRSPFAARYAERLLSDGRRVSSAGWHPTEGRRSPGPALAAAARWQVDLAEHRSLRLTEAMIRAADAIFVFDVQDYLTVRKAHPSARGRVHLLATTDLDGPPMIADPYGRPAGVFEQTYDRVAGIIERNAHAG